MFRFLRRFWPATLRVQLMLILLPVVGLPIIATGYVLKQRGHETFIEEKRGHLQGIGALLEQHLKDRGGYGGLMAGYHGPVDDREAQILYLNHALRGYTDQVAQAFPDVGVGYFHLGLNAIVTYGPSAEYGRTVGITIPPEHPGWKVMTSGKAMTFSGDLVRGNIMNAMRPILENGRVVGYIWSNEFLDAIDRQAATMRLAVYGMTLAGFALSLFLVFFVITRLTRDMEQVKQGLLRLRFDLSEPIAPVKGEIGEIVEAINELARALQEARSMHHNILDSLSEAVITVDLENRVTYINPAGCGLFHCQTAEVVGRPYLTLFRENAHFSSFLLDALQSGREYHGVELDYPLPLQTLRVVASCSRLFDGRGHQLGVVVIIRDISETHQLQQQVARSDRLAAIGEMAAGIAHDLRTPLTSIRGFVQYLQGSTDPGEWQEYGNIIIREVDGLNRIVSTLLDLARPQTLHTEPAELNRLVEETLLLVPDSESDGRITFSLSLAGGLPPVEIDCGQIKQVLLNVLINAIQAISGNGEIRITTAADDAGGVIIRIADNGCGISDEARKRIFDPFFSTKPTGTGLGMAIARKIIESHHGHIEVVSEAGQGCMVTITLPTGT